MQGLEQMPARCPVAPESEELGITISNAPTVRKVAPIESCLRLDTTIRQEKTLLEFFEFVTVLA